LSAKSLQKERRKAKILSKKNPKKIIFKTLESGYHKKVKEIIR